MTTAMAGEPAATRVTEARLVSARCEDQQRVAENLAKAQIRQMRREVDAELKRWARTQPDRWASYQHIPQLRLGAASIGGYGTGIGGLGLSGIGRGGGGPSIGLGSVGSAGGGARPPAKATSASGTNNQVAGVQEADIVKTDGTHVYITMNGALHIEALNPRRVSVTKLDGHPFVHGAEGFGPRARPFRIGTGSFRAELRSFRIGLGASAPSSELQNRGAKLPRRAPELQNRGAKLPRPRESYPLRQLSITPGARSSAACERRFGERSESLVFG
ncbi:MAG: beta-propeller domain-containing protein, partial [Myxococcota bacterium]